MTLPENDHGDHMGDYFIESAQNSIIQTVALKAEAEEKGFTLPEDYQSEYDSVVDAMATNAANAGFTDEEGNGDVLAYIQDSYGRLCNGGGI